MELVKARRLAAMRKQQRAKAGGRSLAQNGAGALFLHFGAVCAAGWAAKLKGRDSDNLVWEVRAINTKTLETRLERSAAGRLG